MNPSAEGPVPTHAELLPVVCLPAGAHVLCKEPEPPADNEQVLHVGIFVTIVVLWSLVWALHHTIQCVSAADASLVLLECAKLP